MKKIIACILACAMLIACAASALAEGMDERLRAVTALVKERCGVSDRYTGFSGDSVSSGGKELWYLNWTADDGSGVSTTSDENGWLYNYSVYGGADAGNYDPYYAPSVPKYDAAGCTAAAEAFLKNVLPETEGFRLDETVKTLVVHGANYAAFSGVITRGGLDTDTTFSVQIDTETMQVESFWRNDQWNYIAREDAADAAVLDAQSAEKILEDAIRMELQYAVEGDQATLRYVPESDGDYTLRAVTGELFDWNAAGEDDIAGCAEAGTGLAGDAPKEAQLTDVEIAGSERLKGALTRDQLDSAARAMQQLGVTGEYALQSVAYSVQEERVTAQLRYMAQAGDVAGYVKLLGMTEADAQDAAADFGSAYIYRSITLDAHTGALLACSTYGGVSGSYDAPYGEDDLSAAEAKADLFLHEYAPAHAANLRVERVDSQVSDLQFDPCAQVQFVRVENGVPVPADGASVTVNMATGFIDAFSLDWTDGVTFEPVEGVIGEEAAYAAYCSAVAAKLRWHALPMAYIDYQRQYDMALCYDLVSDPAVIAVGAKDGKLVAAEAVVSEYDYSDVTGTAANALAAYGVGIPGGSFLPEQLITWREAAKLLVQLDGTNAWDFDDDMLVLYARNDWIALDAAALDSYVTRGELLKTLLDMSGYGRAAAVAGAFSTSFTDAETFGDSAGYAALAEAMNLVEPGADGALAPADELSRGEAAEIVWRFVNR